MNIMAVVIETEVFEDHIAPEGFLYASVKNIGRAVATVNGVSLSPGEAKDYPFVGKGYQAIICQVGSNASLRILRVI